MPETALRRLFEAGQLTSFAEADLYGEWREKSFVSRVMPPPPLGDLARMAQQPDLSPFMGDLDRYLKKFTFGQGTIDDWQSRYLFPRKISVAAFCAREENRNCDASSVVNRDIGSIRSWVQDEIIPTVRHGTDRINVLIGGVGAGKSTFNKFVTSCFFDDFRAAQVVTSRIEYRKLYAFVRTRYEPTPAPGRPQRAILQQAIQQYVYCCVARDLFHYAWSQSIAPDAAGGFGRTFGPSVACSWPELDLDTREGSAAFADFVEERYGGSPSGSLVDVAATTKEVRKAAVAFRANDLRKRSHWFQDLVMSPDRQATLEPYVQFAAEKGVGFFVIFDGLDYVQVSDFIAYTSHRAILNGIADWLIESGRRIYLPGTKEHLHPTFQVTMRPNTYELFWSGYSPALFETQGSIYYVVPAEFRDIFKNISTLRFWSEGTGSVGIGGELMEMFSKIQTSLAKAIGLRPRKIRSLFMNNTRYRVHFTRNVLEEILRSTLNKLDSKKTDRSQPNILEQLRLDGAELLDGREYRLVDMLLHSKNDRFANFVQIEGEGLDLESHAADPTYLEGVLRDNNIRSGYIGNVFNYHIPYRSREDIEFFLEKLRILDVLVRNGREAMTVGAIAEQFKCRGWRLSPYADFSVGILVRENMIAGFSVAAGSSGYIATDLGYILRSHLVTNMTYLENVFFGCFLPLGVKRRALDMFRNNVHRRDWVAGSIFHCWLFLRLVLTAEEGGGQSFFEEIRSSVAATVDRILSARSVDPLIAQRALSLIEDFEESVKQ